MKRVLLAGLLLLLAACGGSGTPGSSAPADTRTSFQRYVDGAAAAGVSDPSEGRGEAQSVANESCYDTPAQIARLLRSGASARGVQRSVYVADRRALMRAYCPDQTVNFEAAVAGAAPP